MIRYFYEHTVERGFTLWEVSDNHSQWIGQHHYAVEITKERYDFFKNKKATVL